MSIKNKMRNADEEEGDEKQEANELIINFQNESFTIQVCGFIQ